MYTRAHTLNLMIDFLSLENLCIVYPDSWLKGRSCLRRHGQTDGRMDGRMGGRTDGWADGRTDILPFYHARVSVAINEGRNALLNVKTKSNKSLPPFFYFKYYNNHI